MGPFLHIVLVFAVTLVWFIIGYQLVLAIAGFVCGRRARCKRATFSVDEAALAPITILIPAHNEEKVIERTVLSMLALEYPAGRLKVMVTNDASSDETGAICDRMAAENPRVTVFHRDKVTGGKGKAAALNAAVELIQDEFIAIYDADNRPEPDAIKLLMARFVEQPELGAVLGKFRTGNRRRNLLTRFINIEGLGFQGIMQSGRWQLMRASALSGTNYIIRRSVVKAVGGWDVEALAEDAELSVRMYQAGYTIAFVPYSRAWEQEPETFGVWLKQRTRWARGNNYTVAKLFATFSQSHSRLVAFEILVSLLIPYALLFAVLSTQVVFLLTILRIHITYLTGIPTYFLWIAVLFYYVEILLVLANDHEFTLENVLVTALMYFTYCQLWPLAFLRALWADLVIHKQREWDKTVRFNDDIEGYPAPAFFPGTLASVRAKVE